MDNQDYDKLVYLLRSLLKLITDEHPSSIHPYFTNHINSFIPKVFISKSKHFCNDNKGKQLLEQLRWFKIIIDEINKNNDNPNCVTKRELNKLFDVCKDLKYQILEHGCVELKGQEVIELLNLCTFIMGSIKECPLVKWT